MGEVTVERVEGEALAGDDRRRLEELQRDAETARARLDALRTLADELREDSVRNAETAGALRAELDGVRAGETEAREALRAELAAVREAEDRCPRGIRALRDELAGLEPAARRTSI